MHIRMRTLILLTVVVHIMSCTRSEIPKGAKPVSARLTEYELAGNVRSVIVESKQSQDSTTEQVDYSTTMAFDRNGILQEHGFIKRSDEKITEENIIRNILDNKGRLVRINIQSPMNVPEQIEYQYSVKESSITLKPKNILVPKKGITWYEQNNLPDRYEIIVHWGDSDDLIKRSTFKNNELQELCFYNQFSGKKYCIHYSNNKKVSMTTFDWNSNAPIEATYQYKSTSEWPTGCVFTIQAITQKVEAYEYVLDSRNNWIEKYTYEIIPSVPRKLLAHEIRTILYY